MLHWRGNTGSRRRPAAFAEDNGFYGRCTEMKKNFYLDVVLFIACLTCIITGVVMDFHLFSGGREVKMQLRAVHLWAGYIMGVGFLLHIAWHTGWIKYAAKQVLGKKE